MTEVILYPNKHTIGSTHGRTTLVFHGNLVLDPFMGAGHEVKAVFSMTFFKLSNRRSG